MSDQYFIDICESCDESMEASLLKPIQRGEYEINMCPHCVCFMIINDESGVYDE